MAFSRSDVNDKEYCFARYLSTFNYFDTNYLYDLLSKASLTIILKFLPSWNFLCSKVTDNDIVSIIEQAVSLYLRLPSLLIWYLSRHPSVHQDSQSSNQLQVFSFHFFVMVCLFYSIRCG